MHLIFWPEMKSYKVLKIYGTMYRILSNGVMKSHGIWVSNICGNPVKVKTLKITLCRTSSSEFLVTGVFRIVYSMLYIFNLLNQHCKTGCWSLIPFWPTKVKTLKITVCRTCSSDFSVTGVFRIVYSMLYIYIQFTQPPLQNRLLADNTILANRS